MRNAGGVKVFSRSNRGVRTQKTAEIPVKVHNWEGGWLCKLTNHLKRKKSKKSCKKVLTKGDEGGIIYKLSRETR